MQDEKKLALITFLMFFLPGTPKDLLTYVLGLSKVKRTDLLILAGVARLPSIITSTVGGSLLGTEKYLFAVIVFGITFLISAAGWIIYNRKTNKRC